MILAGGMIIQVSPVSSYLLSAQDFPDLLCHRNIAAIKFFKLWIFFSVESHMRIEDVDLRIVSFEYPY